MILRTLRLENFGLYLGCNEIDLVPRRRTGGDNPIVLIGGKNGAGKTTLLEAVRLALYGRRSLGARVGQSDYDEYLRSRVHRSATPQAAGVSLEFDYAEAGIIHRYLVRRDWAVRGKAIVETLLLDKDGVTITSVPRDEWNHFLQELIPPGVSQLFFFDGEKVREIADVEEENEQLAEAVRGLLGIELVSRLRTDIGLYLARHQHDDGSTLATRLETLVRDIGIAERRAEALNDEVAELTSARESQARAAEQMRRRFISEGGDAALHRARTEGDRDSTRRRIAQCENQFRELANHLLPFAVAPRLIASFRAGLGQVTASKVQKEAVVAFRQAFETWVASGQGKQAASWTPKHWTDLDRFVSTYGSNGRRVGMIPAFKEIGDGTAALAHLDEVEAVVRPQALALLAEVDDLNLRYAALGKAVERADSAAAGFLLDELRLADQRVGSTEATLKSRQDELKLLRGQLVTLERERRRILEDQAAAAVDADRAALAARTAQALANYERQLLEHKLVQLRAEFVRRFNHLARKTDLIADVRIDPGTFAATLIDRHAHEVPKADLSAGEKQIYAIAMLWALARTSGRPLPMIIDTPLARLDSEHRANLVNRYFPAASHQVILLSTDTELDEALVKELGASVSHSYRLDYDGAENRTIISRGYFGKEGTGTRSHALQQA